MLHLLLLHHDHAGAAPAGVETGHLDITIIIINHHYHHYYHNHHHLPPAVLAAVVGFHQAEVARPVVTAN